MSHVPLGPTRSFLALAALAIAAGCGSRTGLLVDTVVARDAGAEGTDAAVGCHPGVFTLTRAIPAVMFVLDRSGSMSQRFDGGASRWTVLTHALMSTLPPVDSSIETGVLLYPTAGASSTCAVSPAVDLAPALGHVGALIGLMQAHGPSGGTPTAAALDVAAEALRATRAASTARALVLATDGAPDCNSGLDSSTCTCPQNNCKGHPSRCLDDTRCVQTITSDTASGIPTYVIGIQDPINLEFSDVLDAMAIAGGRPNIGGSHSYYAASSAAELDSALVTIRNQVGACTYLTTSVPSIDGAITVTIDGIEIPYDPTGTSGWRWAEKANGEIVFAAAACAVAANPSASLSVNVTCSEPDAGQGGVADASLDASPDGDAEDADRD